MTSINRTANEVEKALVNIVTTQYQRKEKKTYGKPVNGNILLSWKTTM